MTLLELLRQELPKRGGWPEGAACVVQSLIDGELYFYDRRYDGNGAMLDLRRSGYKFCKASDIGRDDVTGLLTPIVTREQYETTGWDGTGLPPVGCECEFMKHTLDTTLNWRRGIIKYVSEYTVVIVEALSPGEFVAHPRTCNFRPLRTEAERAIDEMVRLSGVSIGAAKILYDAGYRKG